MIFTVACIVGMVAGSGMILVACIVYLRTHQFGYGGTVLTGFGTILLGFSVWKNVDFSAGKDGVNFKFDAIEKQLMTAKTVASAAANAATTANKLADDAVRHQLVSPPLGDGTSELLQKTVAENPQDVIAIMHYIQLMVDQGSFPEAVGYFEAMKKANRSGVGYSIYPAIAFAFERVHEPLKANEVLEELRSRVNDDIGNGYGFLSRALTIGWTVDSLKKYRTQVADSEVQGEYDQTISTLRNDIAKLSGIDRQ